MSTEAIQWVLSLSKKDVSSSEKHLLTVLAFRSNLDCECWPSLKRLVSDTGMDLKTIKRCRSSLMKKHLLSYTGEMKGRTNSIPLMKLNVQIDQESRESQNGLPYDLSRPKNGLGSRPQNGLPKQAQKRTPEIEVLERKEESVCGASAPTTPTQVFSESIQTAFTQKFTYHQITIEQLYLACKEHHGKSYNETKFLNWIRREDVSNHDLKPAKPNYDIEQIEKASINKAKILPGLSGTREEALAAMRSLNLRR